MKLLITGGTGYIGSHTCVELLEEGHELVVVDNLCNSSKIALDRVETITGQKVDFHKVDIRNKGALDEVFNQYDFDGVIHFAALKAVGESVKKPLLYYQNNVAGSLTLYEVMKEHSVKTIVFSSSATVYGDPDKVPIKEDFPVTTTNPYGSTKLMMENILKDLYNSDNEWNVGLLRYFNPIGAHPSGLIGEDPNGIPDNLLPYISQVAVGKRDKLQVYGDDYPTHDGTGVRDYIHVVDLAKGHLAALDKLQESPGVVTYNLGTGRGYSVLEVVEAFEKASGQEVPYEITDRRPGDAAEVWADPTKAKEELGWEAKYDLDDMCEHIWKWQSNNPNGYEE